MLGRQLIRSLWRNKRSYFACVLLLAVGVAVYVSFHLLFVNLTAAMDSMYRQQRFGDVFASVALLPLSAADKLAAIDGVEQLDATIVADARVLGEHSSRIVTLRLSSFDPGDTRRLNDFVLVRGTLPDTDGVLVSDVFAATNGLSVGDRIPLLLDGVRCSPVIAGTVQSPEYVYAIPDSGQLMPDNEAFGFGYMPVARLGALTGKSGFATNLSLLLDGEHSFSALKPQLEDALRPYGLRSLIERADQPSHVMLDQQLRETSSMASSFPSLFILIAVVILYIMLGRMVEQDRTQIGVLKAFGFRDSTLLAHYMGYGAATGLAGGVAGIALGLGMTGALTDVYLEFFHLPAVEAAPRLAYLLRGLLIALAAGILGALMGARPVLRLSPADAMRPPAPPAVRGDLAGRLPFLRSIFDSYGYMSLRNITRNKFRSAFVLLGIAVSFALTAFMASYGDMFDALLFDQFTQVEVYNLRISLTAPAPRTAALEEAWRMPGVRRAEGVLELPVELLHGHLKKGVSITAIEPDSQLYRIRGDDGEALPPSFGGLILSSSLAEDLRAARGDRLYMTTPYTGEERIALPVLGVVESNLGATAYIQLEGLWELLAIPPTVSGILLDAGDPDAVKAALLDAEGVASITDQQEAIRMYTDLLDTYAVLLYLLQLAGTGIAFAIITNTAAISLSERKREYATMRVLGMHPAEIGRVVSLEYWLLFAVALPPGILLTRAFKQAMARMIDNELFSMPLHTGPASFFKAAALCALAVLLSGWWVRGKIAGFDMAFVLKERE